MMTKPTLSRRDFLKLSASGALGLVLSELGIDRALPLFASQAASSGAAFRFMTRLVQSERDALWD
jgi:hypothetical protein